MARLSGSFGRILKAPGYHVKAKYDLHGTRDRLYGGGGHSDHFDLNLTAMVDMFSMLVMFLLMNFSTTGEVFFISKDVKIPDASHGRPLESKPLITITSQNVIFDAEKIGENPIHLEESDQELPQLKARLQQVRIMEQTIHPDKPFKGEVNIQADEMTSLVYVKRVMNTLISEGWTGIHFAVQNRSKPRVPAETQGR